jgi:hypothetical protein
VKKVLLWLYNAVCRSFQFFVYCFLFLFAFDMVTLASFCSGVRMERAPAIFLGTLNAIFFVLPTLVYLLGRILIVRASSREKTVVCLKDDKVIAFSSSFWKDKSCSYEVLPSSLYPPDCYKKIFGTMGKTTVILYFYISITLTMPVGLDYYATLREITRESDHPFEYVADRLQKGLDDNKEEVFRFARFKGKTAKKKIMDLLAVPAPFGQSVKVETELILTEIHRCF